MATSDSGSASRLRRRCAYRRTRRRRSARRCRYRSRRSRASRERTASAASTTNSRPPRTRRRGRRGARSLRNGARAMKRICVFCGSRTGNGDEYAPIAARCDARTMVARRLRHRLRRRQRRLDGHLADTALACGGEVIGVIPQALAAAEIAHAGLARAARRQDDARAQGDHGRLSDGVHRVARRLRHDGRILRSADVAATAHPRQAHRVAELSRLLRRTARGSSTRWLAKASSAHTRRFHRRG